MRPKIYMLMGLPGAGKTTMAMEMVYNLGVKRVSKDDIRKMVQNGTYSPESEPMILAIRNSTISAIIRSGRDVIVDDTNLNPVHQETIGRLAITLDADFVPMRLKTSLEDCILRDKIRKNPAGEEVIRKMAEQYGLS